MKAFKLKTDALLAVAHHEAAHAVVALALGGQVVVVELGPQPYARCGHRTAEDRGVTALAGDLAEQRACPKSRPAAAVDMNDAIACAERTAPDAPVEALKRFARVARRLVDERWGEIAVVAAALIKRGRLTGAEIDVVIRSEMGSQDAA